MDAIGKLYREHGVKISGERQIELHKKAMEGDKAAKDEFVMGFFGLALKLARKHKPLNVDIEDAQSEAFVAVMQAMPSWKPELGKFSTILTNRICWNFSRLANDDQMIRTPANWTKEDRAPLKVSIKGQQRKDGGDEGSRATSNDHRWCQDHTDPTKPAEDRDTIRLVDTKMKELHALDAMIVRRSANGETLKAIANDMRVSWGRVQQRKQRGMTYLRTDREIMALMAD
jgi:RNA polymerase sigma factor (sigma-70 family)